MSLRFQDSTELQAPRSSSSSQLNTDSVASVIDIGVAMRAI